MRRECYFAALFAVCFPCLVPAIPWRDCRKPLFLDRYDPTISMFNASSSKPDSEHVYDPRTWPYPYLQKDPTVKWSGWCPAFDEITGDVYLEVDLGMEVDITGIATQGDGYLTKYYTERYTLNFSRDGKNYFADTPPQDPKNAPSDEHRRETVVTHWFPADRRVTARHVRVIGLSCRPDLICCLRFELFGCDGDIRNPVGLIHGQFSPRFLKVSSYYLYGKEYVYSGLDNMDKGWTVNGGSPQLDLFLESHHLLTGISLRPCTGRQCPLPLVFRAVMWNNSDSWIYFKYNSEVGVRSYFWVPDFINHKMITFKDFIVGNKVSILDTEGPLCSYPTDTYGFCLHLEFYGKDLACKTPFGVEWGHRHDRSLVKDEQMTASSTESGSEPYFGRLRFSSKAWCPHGNMIRDQYSQKEQYLQIDFVFASKITGVTTQGLRSKYVTFYNLYYALDIDMFHCYVNEYGLCKLFKGNSNGDSESTHWLTSPITVRYLRFNPKNWVNFPCFRVEVYGCKAGPCYTSLGMEYGMISNSQIQASSETQDNKKDWSRLNSLGWCVGGTETYYYLQIDFLTLTLVTGVVTQGKYEESPDQYAQAVTSFYLRYSLLGDKWLKYHTLLKGEYKGNNPVRHWLDPPFVAQHVQFNPKTSFTRHMCMRVDVYGCYTPELMPDHLTLGMESFSISDSYLTASSKQDELHGPECSRLNHHVNDGAWIPKTSDASQFLQIDTGWVVILTGIAIQGHPALPYRTTSFQMKLATNVNQQFEPYPRGKTPKEFVSVDNDAQTMFHTLSPSAYCRYVQIHPVSWVEKIALRVELYGYEAECSRRLGMIGGGISYKQLTSSSIAHDYSQPRYGRLNMALGYGAWSPETQDKNQYLQVDLLKEMFVSGVATQGSKFYDCWVSSYKLLYRGNGEVWIKYTEADVEQVIIANEDRDTIVLYFFSLALVAQYVRFLPQSWNNEICMRIELYGCPMDQFACGDKTGCSSNAVCLTLDKENMACVCKEGYRGDGKTCDDVDECANEVSPCPSHTDCANTVGSFTCNCRPGFVKDGSSCADVNECKNYICPSSMACINTFGSFTCDCGDGKQYDVTAKTCIDIDECSTGQYSCNPLARCVNTVGSYYCECAAGYRGRGKVVCTDVNECRQTPGLCGNNSVCSNTKGGYECLCKKGYVKSNDKCIDYDECSNEAHECPRRSTCVNTVGSYQCQCKEGFFRNGPYCIDLNECQGKHHNCDVNAWCTNTAGSFKCFCKKGYQGDGMTCKKQSQGRGGVPKVSHRRTVDDENQKGESDDASYCQPGDENCER
ncbi:uncharacterized protein LOC144627995 isoform X2 [Oculina patagonica]